MADIEYKKISALPQVTSLSETDVFIVNANGTTSKISLSDLAKIIVATHSIKDLSNSITALQNKVTALEQTVATHDTTINNIVTASFNLIGIE